VSTSSPVVLAAGQIDSDQLVIELVQGETPPAILIIWPVAPTVSLPHRFDAPAAVVMRVMANAVVTLAQRKAGDRQQTTD
jgi:hypothetical protein